MADNTNPGNFANRDKDEVRAIGQKGGQATGTGGFASMDPDKQVRELTALHHNCHANASMQKEIASQGGKASSGSFEPGSEAAKEAGRKGGSSS